MRFVIEYKDIPQFKGKFRRDIIPRYSRLIKAANTLLSEIDKTYLG